MMLSILIPARNEMFLKNTIEDIVAHREAETEVIVILDGQWCTEPIPQYNNVNIIYVSKSIGQRAATNMAARMSRSKYVMKVDAHCSFDQGFDRKMIEGIKEVGDDVTMVPIMRNLWVFDWKCYKCGWKKYQGPVPAKCDHCGDTTHMKRKLVWIGKHNPQSTSYCFNKELRFQYFEDYKHRPVYIKDKANFTETMSLQGSCFMLTREKYWDLNICDETWGSWGQQGTEVALKTWLSGGRVLCNHRTWYAHLFRTQPGFSFPWPVSGKGQQRAREICQDVFRNNKWERQIHPLQWLIDKFTPVPDWKQEDIDKLPSTL